MSPRPFNVYMDDLSKELYVPLGLVAMWEAISLIICVMLMVLHLLVYVQQLSM